MNSMSVDYLVLAVFYAFCCQGVISDDSLKEAVSSGQETVSKSTYEVNRKIDDVRQQFQLDAAYSNTAGDKVVAEGNNAANTSHNNLHQEAHMRVQEAVSANKSPRAVFCISKALIQGDKDIDNKLDKMLDGLTDSRKKIAKSFTAAEFQINLLQSAITELLGRSSRNITECIDVVCVSTFMAQATRMQKTAEEALGGITAAAESTKREFNEDIAEQLSAMKKNITRIEEKSTKKMRRC